MMKALFSRIRGRSKDKDNDPTRDSPPTKEKLLNLGPLPEWPPPQRAMSTPNSLPPIKPLPDIGVPLLPPAKEKTSPSTDSAPTPTPTSPRSNTTTIRAEERTLSQDRATSPRHEQEASGRTSRKATNGSTTTTSGNSEAAKKVAFVSPKSTPSAAERPLPDAPSNGPQPGGVPVKTTLSRFQATHGKDPRGSTSTAASSSKTNVASGSTVSVKSTRTATSPLPHKSHTDVASLHQSVRSGTPYSQMSNTSSTRILATASWSEGAEEDLVCNLGPRERTRQEVLWEIVASEERYVAELLKMKETFIEPVLHPFSASSPGPLTPRSHHHDFEDFRADSPQESLEQLPIASRFMSPVGFRPETPTSPLGPSTRKDDLDKDTPNIDGESLDSDEDEEGDDQLGKGYSSRAQAAKHSHPRSPYRATATRTSGRSGGPVPFPTSHQSLPPRTNPTSSTQSLGRSALPDRERKFSQGSVERKMTPTQGSRVLRKFRKSQTASDAALVGGAVPPHQLPEDLRICFEAVESGIMEGHMRLSEGLRKRYDEQYPLVRSLADVFVTHSHLFHGYATYVLHLERALEQVDNALSNTDKKPKNQDAAAWMKVCKFLQRLEENAAEKGETGLAISLSKPFQRLLKYPLLFQNLLFHTDPSTFEYESTLQMVAEVETIVRSIEDEKIQKEERDKTRDVFARIEGLDKVKQLALPKPSRVLVDERLYLPAGSMQNGNAKGSSSPPSAMAVKGKTSFKRLSDVLHSGTGIGGKKDLWLVVFNDVVLQCQRTGTTSLPLVSATNSRTNSLPDLQGKAKYATTGRRTAQTKPRNLYKFLKIETWAIGNVIQPREGVVSMEDVVRSRAQVHSAAHPRILPLPDDTEDDGTSSDHSDTKSKMSFSYWGADKVTIQKPAFKQRQLGMHGGPRRGGGPAPSSYGRESSANAKFGTRLVSDQSSPNGRPASRRTQATPPASRRPQTSEDTNSAKATVTRPAWDSNTRSYVIPGAKRSRNTSQTSAAPRLTTPATATVKQLASPAPSEDSGVGFYRQMIVHDPSITETSST